jgi:hypothetical protein
MSGVQRQAIITGELHFDKLNAAHPWVGCVFPEGLVFSEK